MLKYFNILYFFFCKFYVDNVADNSLNRFIFYTTCSSILKMSLSFRNNIFHLSFVMTPQYGSYI